MPKTNLINRKQILLLSLIFLIQAFSLLISYTDLFRLEDLDLTIQIIIFISNIITLTLLFELMLKGTLINSRTWHPLALRICMAILLVASLFKIMHWPWAGMLLVIGALGMPIIYSIWFLSKGIKRMSDYLKVLLVFFIFTTSLCKIMHWPSFDELNQSIIRFLLFWLVIGVYIWERE